MSKDPNDRNVIGYYSAEEIAPLLRMLELPANASVSAILEAVQKLLDSKEAADNAATENRFYDGWDS